MLRLAFALDQISRFTRPAPLTRLSPRKVRVRTLRASPIRLRVEPFDSRWAIASVARAPSVAVIRRTESRSSVVARAIAIVVATARAIAVVVSVPRTRGHHGCGGAVVARWGRGR